MHRLANNWLSSFLKNRKQYVFPHGISSSNKTIACGVPQGSILGPLLLRGNLYFLVQWLRGNKLSLNETKINLILFRLPWKQLLGEPDIRLRN